MVSKTNFYHVIQYFVCEIFVACLLLKYLFTNYSGLEKKMQFKLYFMDWNFGLESWSGLLERNLGNVEWHSKLNSGGEIYLRVNIHHHKMCNICITHTSNG